MRITFAKYAFKDILQQLQYSGITDITITKEDGNLIIVIPDEAVSKVVSRVPTTDETVPYEEYDKRAGLASDDSEGYILNKKDIDPELLNAVKIVSKAMEAEGIFKNRG